MDGAERHRGDGGIAGREDRHGDALGILQGGAHAIERREEVADRIGAARGLEGGQAEACGLHGLEHEGAAAGAVRVDLGAHPHDLPLVARPEGVEGGAMDGG